MGFYLEKNTDLIKQIIEMDKAAAAADTSMSTMSLVELRKAYRFLRTEVEVMQNTVYKQLKERRKATGETDDEGDDED